MQIGFRGLIGRPNLRHISLTKHSRAITNKNVNFSKNEAQRDLYGTNHLLAFRLVNRK